MPIARGGYGFDLFGAGDYGVEGTTKLASALITSSGATAGTIERVREVSASASASASTTSSCVRKRLSGALVSSTASTASVGEKFVLKESDKFSYGTGAYGVAVYDNANLQTIVSSTSSVADVTVVRIRPASASASASSSFTSSGVRVPEGAATVSAASEVTASGQFSVTGDATASAVSTNTATIARVRLIGGAISSTSSFAAIAREKWELIGYDSQTWEPVGHDSQTWDTIGETSITWSNVA